MIAYLVSIGIPEQITSVVGIHQLCKYNQKNFTSQTAPTVLNCCKQNLQNLEISYILMPPKPSFNFIDQVTIQLQQYQHEKAIRLDLNQPEPSHQENRAKQTLIDLDDETQPTENVEDDVAVGRWPNYRVPLNIEERLSIGKKSRRNSVNPPPTCRYLLDSQEKNCLPLLCRSEKTIPKLKVILHQLECPLNLVSQRKPKPGSGGPQPKMRNHIGMEALVISNREEIKPSIKSSRKGTLMADPATNSQNLRPPSSHFKATPASSSYQKIKRTIGSPQDGELVYQKQILSQLIKGSFNRTNENPLSNMMNFFTRTDSKRKVSTKLGLDKLLS